MVQQTLSSTVEHTQCVTLLGAADIIYWRNYAPAMILSGLDVGYSVHIVIIGSIEDCDRVLLAALETTYGDRFSWTAVDDIHRSTPSYACERFFHAEKMLQDGRTVLVSDVDVIFRNKIEWDSDVFRPDWSFDDPAFAAHQDSWRREVASFHNIPFEWVVEASQHKAHAELIGLTPIALPLAEALVRNIDILRNEGTGDRWGIDQVALSRAWIDIADVPLTETTLRRRYDEHLQPIYTDHFKASWRDQGDWANACRIYRQRMADLVYDTQSQECTQLPALPAPLPLQDTGDSDEDEVLVESYDNGEPFFGPPSHRSRMEVYINSPNTALRIQPGTTRREHFNPHAYRCQPLLDANRFGWDIISSVDITIENKRPVGKPGYTHFAMDTFTLDVGYTWVSKADILIMPVPNAEQWEWQALTALIDTRSCVNQWFLTIRSIADNYTIPAGTRLARIIPVDRRDLSQLTLLPLPPGLQDAAAIFSKNRERGNEKEIKALHQYQKTTTKVKTPSPILMEDTYVVHNFLQNEECAYLISEWENTVETSGDDEIWAHRTKYSANLQDIPGRVLVEAQRTLPGATMSDPHLVRWQTGESMPMHADHANGQFPERDWTAVIFLNDDYEGGQHYFEEGEIEPERGMLILHKGGTRLHGVREVSGCNRYTFVCWLCESEK